MHRILSLVLLLGSVMGGAVRRAPVKKESVIVTVINNSSLPLLPTAEGMIGGCIGGSIPPLFHPLHPGETHNITLIFVDYSPTCKFNLLPLPSEVTLLNGCTHIGRDATVIFNGGKIAVDLHCSVVKPGEPAIAIA